MEEFPKSLEDQTKSEVKQISEDRINFKLSLRKKKFNEILIKKRIASTKPEESPWSLELFLSELKLSSQYKIKFDEEKELISVALKSIKSDDILTLKYGICLFKNYINSFIDDNNPHFYINLNFVSDLLNLLEKWGEKQEKQIIFNILNLLTNYSYINNNKLISKIILSSKGYKIWELCFNLQNYEIMSQMIWVLSNITFNDEEASYNLLKSNLFQQKIFNFYKNPTVINHLNEDNKNNLFFFIIERGLCLLKNLLLSESSSTYNKEENYKLFIQIFNLILKYSDSNSPAIFHICVYIITKSISNERRLINLLDNSNLLNDILNKKFFSDEKIVVLCNRILGEYTEMKANLSQDFYDKCIKYEIDILFNAKESKTIVELFWVLSNILHDNINSGEIICLNEPFIDKVLYIFKNSIDFNYIKETSYFFLILCKTVKTNTFIQLLNKGLFDITFEHAKNTLDEPKKLILIFELIKLYLDTGDFFEENFGGKNIIKEKCDNYGLIDLLKKYEYTENVELNDIIEKIMNDYYIK